MFKYPPTIIHLNHSFFILSLKSSNSFLQSFPSLNVGIISDTSSTITKEFLIDAFEGTIFLSSRFLDAILVVLVVLVLGRVVFVFSHSINYYIYYFYYFLLSLHLLLYKIHASQ